MNETNKFGQFDWKCWKDKKPDDDKFIYAYLPWNDDNIDVGPASDFNFRDSDYWCYVYMPDAPKIEKIKLKPGNILYGCSNDYILALEQRIEKLESQMKTVWRT